MMVAADEDVGGDELLEQRIERGCGREKERKRRENNDESSDVTGLGKKAAATPRVRQQHT